MDQRQEGSVAFLDGRRQELESDRVRPCELDPTSISLLTIKDSCDKLRLVVLTFVNV